MQTKFAFPALTGEGKLNGVVSAGKVLRVGPALSSTAVLSPVTAAVLCAAHRLICFELDETSIPERLMRSCSGFLTRKKFLIP